MKILVTGGAGFIGSHVVDAYVEAGHDVVVVDDLSSGKPENVNAKAKLVQMDIRDAGFERVVAEHRIEVISHHAAQMDVRRSVADPAFDAIALPLVTGATYDDVVAAAQASQTYAWGYSAGKITGSMPTVPMYSRIASNVGWNSDYGDGFLDTVGRSRRRSDVA